uniref:(northern house mosquito) hypothetical protein n=1 Tax=Culex pipiens TaxID=7175 RepID=A0A8D8D3N6_CULPI
MGATELPEPLPVYECSSNLLLGAGGLSMSDNFTNEDKLCDSWFSDTVSSSCFCFSMVACSVSIVCCDLRLDPFSTCFGEFSTASTIVSICFPLLAGGSFTS